MYLSIFAWYLGGYIYFISTKDLGVGVKLPKSPNISYLIFIDDLFIFYTATKQAAREVTDILEVRYHDSLSIS